MSVSYKTHCIEGFEVSVCAVYTHVTKYHPDTGVPYEKRVHSHNELFANNVFVGTDKGEPLYDGCTYQGVNVIEIDDQLYFGTRLGEVSEDNRCIELDTVGYDAAWAAFCDDHQLPDPKRYLVMDIG